MLLKHSLKGFLTLAPCHQYFPSLELDQQPGQVQPGKEGQMEHDGSATILEMDHDCKQDIQIKRSETKGFKTETL